MSCDYITAPSNNCIYVLIAFSISLILMNSSAECERLDSPGPSLNEGNGISAWSDKVGEQKKLGPLENLLKLIPGARKMGLNNVKIDPKDMAHIEAIVLSMTPKERRNPEIIKASRKTRIAKGSGRSVQEVNKLLQQFDQMKKMMKQVTNGNMKLPF